MIRRKLNTSGLIGYVIWVVVSRVGLLRCSPGATCVCCASGIWSHARVKPGITKPAQTTTGRSSPIEGAHEPSGIGSGLTGEPTHLRTARRKPRDSPAAWRPPIRRAGRRRPVRRQLDLRVAILIVAEQRPARAARGDERRPMNERGKEARGHSREVWDDRPASPEEERSGEGCVSGWLRGGGTRIEAAAGLNAGRHPVYAQTLPQDLTARVDLISLTMRNKGLARF